MFNRGILAIFLATIIGPLAVTAEKKVASNFANKETVLVWKYIFVTFFATIYMAIMAQVEQTVMIPVLTYREWILLITVVFVGYLGIYWILKAYEHMCAAITGIIVKFYVFLAFFINIFLFNGTEFLPWYQIILAIVFFVVISQFILQERSAPWNFFHLNRYALYPLGASFCGAFYVSSMAWFTKTEIMTPSQTMFVTESMLLFVSLLYYFLWHRGNMGDLLKSFDTSYIAPLSLVGIGITINGYLWYYAYLDNPANVINFIGLFNVVFVAIFGRIFLGDKLSKKQIIIMTLALIVLAAFVLSPSVA